MDGDDFGGAFILAGICLLVGGVIFVLSFVVMLLIYGGIALAAGYGVYLLGKFGYDAAHSALEPWRVKRHYAAIEQAITGEASVTKALMNEAVRPVIQSEPRGLSIFDDEDD